jgi:hypothetical protein
MRRDDYVVGSAIMPLRGSRPSLALSVSVVEALARASDLATHMGHTVVGCEHVLVALLESRDAPIIARTRLDVRSVRARYFHVGEDPNEAG